MEQQEIFMTRFFTATALLVVMMPAAEQIYAREPDLSWFPQAPSMPDPQGEVIRVSNVAELFEAAEEVASGGTILLEDGHYAMPRYFEISTDGVTLRGASGDREKVLLDGAESRHGELVGVRNCSGVTIADLTIRNIRHNGIKINSDTGVHQLTIHNCAIRNVWQRGVKAVRVPKDDPAIEPPKGCRIEYCLFSNDRPKQFEDDPTDNTESFGGNYLGGIDAMDADGWVIADNVFCGLRGRTGEARGAVFLWENSKDCVIERNVLIDCDSGICLGNSFRGKEIESHCRRCTVRNNFLVRCPENGILADYTTDCLIGQNTVYDPESRLKRLIRLVHANEGLVVANNLLMGPPMRVETESEITFAGNILIDELPLFVSPNDGDLHLKEDLPVGPLTVPSIPRVLEDFDRRQRSKLTTVGADDASHGER